MSDLLSTTLLIIAALESNSGTLLAHEPVRNPASIHYGEAAIGPYGMMPKTLQELREGDPTRAAKKLATAILARNSTNIRGYIAPPSPCPLLTAVILWEHGPRKRINVSTWEKKTVQKRLKRARMVWNPVKRGKYWDGRSFL